LVGSSWAFRCSNEKLLGPPWTHLFDAKSVRPPIHRP
jgi:hypothetical protein